MKYNNPELIERLSAEYVLGTLHGKARDRFERLMENSHRVRMAVWNWENHITPIAAVAPPVKTPLHLWPGIKSRIGNGATQRSVQKNNTVVSSWWRVLGLVATTACLVLMVFLSSQNQLLEKSIDGVAIFSNQDAEPQWLVSFDMDSGELKVRALNTIALEAGRAFELWLLPDSGDPQSLGLLPANNPVNTEIVNSLPTALVEILRSANGLAVSIEPEGGSPTGLPTGPVVYQANIVNL